MQLSCTWFVCIRHKDFLFLSSYYDLFHIFFLFTFFSSEKIVNKISSFFVYTAFTFFMFFTLLCSLPLVITCVFLSFTDFLTFSGCNFINFVLYRAILKLKTCSVSVPKLPFPSRPCECFFFQCVKFCIFCIRLLYLRHIPKRFFVVSSKCL